MNEAMWEAKQNLEIWGHKILDVLYEDKDIYSITFIDKNESIIGLIVVYEPIWKVILIDEIIVPMKKSMIMNIFIENVTILLI